MTGGKRLRELHGGNIYRFAEELDMDEKEVVDFSASINPLGISKKVKSALIKNIRYLINYPDPDATELRQHLSKHYHINVDSILCGNGSTELIYLIPRALKPEKVLIPQPTFSEYERACRTASYKLQVTSYKLKQENNFEIDTDAFIKAMKGCDMAFLCNPNNPTGRLLKRAAMLKIAGAAKKLRCYLVVDEAFIDFCPKDSVVNEVCDNPYLIVLRSMTKFYALTGLRIGYGVFHQSVIKKIISYKEPWTVNTIAQRAGVVAMSDIEYRDKTFSVIKQEKKFMEDSFGKLRIDYIPSAVNYYLIRLNNAGEVIHSLSDKEILVRDCSNFAGLNRKYIRIAVKSRKDNMRLLKELSNFLDVIPAKAGIQKTNKLDSASSTLRSSATAEDGSAE
ncbi:MAG: threonine-phosphate decarboxylase CobD [Thermodesulfovibrionales bacterium]